MKRISTIILMLVAVWTLASAQTTKTRQNYVIGFYNLENLFDIYDDPAKNDEQFLPDGDYKWTEAKYKKKLGNMAHVIAEMAKANGRWHTILGISEIENRYVIEDLLDQPELAGSNYQIVHYDGPDRRGVDVALLYNPSNFKLLDSKSIPFTFSANPDYKFTLDQRQKDAFRTRDILMVRGTIDGEMFAFFVAHLPSRVGGKGGDLRSGGAMIIYQYARALMRQYKGIKIVVMGDMNDDPFDESMSKWLHGMEKMEDMKENDFFNPYWSMLKAGYGSLCYRDVWSIYDQELVNYNLAHAPEGTLKIQPVGKGWYGYIFKRPFMTTQKGRYKGYPFRTFSGGSFIGGYSDHYPTFIVVGK